LPVYGNWNGTPIAIGRLIVPQPSPEMSDFQQQYCVFDFVNFRANAKNADRD
jgi:hypothetical protein